jgi:predicted dehydrogenase
VDSIGIGFIGSGFAADLHAHALSKVRGASAKSLPSVPGPGRAWRPSPGSGWQFPSPDEDWMRGYPQEMQDFADGVREGREPLSGPCWRTKP